MIARTTQLSLLLAASLMLATAAAAQITPSQDAYTDSARMRSNFGDDPVLALSGSADSARTAYIQFDLSPIPAGYTSANIAKATLKLYVDNVAAPGAFDVLLAGGPWSEKTLAAEAPPPLGRAIASAIPLTEANRHGYIVVDVTSAVAAWLDRAEPNDGLALLAAGPLSAAFDSKENTEHSHPPQLDIVYAAGAPGAPSLTGITTAVGSGLKGGGTSGNLSLSLITCPKSDVLASAGTTWKCAKPPVGNITGLGKAGYLPFFGTATSLTDSSAFQESATGNIGIGTVKPQTALDVNGAINASTSFNLPYSSTSIPFVSAPGGVAAYRNTAVGAEVLSKWIPNAFTGGSNTAVGFSTMRNTTGGGNTAVGSESLYVNTKGSNNTALGYFALESATGSNNIAIGVNSGPFTNTSISNSTAIGYYADVEQPNSVVLGSVLGVGGCTASVGCTTTSVGIGTTAPAYPLDVAGVIRSSTGGFMFPDGSVQTKAATGGSGGGGGITDVVASTGLSGGGTTSTVTLTVNPAVVAELGNSNTFTNTNSFTQGATFESTSGTALNVEGGSGTALSVDSHVGTGLGVTGSPVAISASGVVNINTSAGTAGALNLTSNVQGAPGIDSVGFSASNGSAGAGTDAIDAYGGGADQTSGGGNGGDGIFAKGGAGYNTGYDGPGGFFTGGNGSPSGASSGDGIDAKAGSGYAGKFIGDLDVTGVITAGTKDFRIDHPLDPANKYLTHASVESSEMMNIYTGNATTDDKGEAIVQLPGWFEALNTDFRYQLTVIGQFAQAIIARKVEHSSFAIRTDKPGVEVSWQITAVRHDAYAQAHPLVVEQEKEARLKGYYIHPELHGAPEEKQIEWARHPEAMRKIKAAAQRPLEAKPAAAQ